MEAVVCVVWGVLLLMYTPSYKAESPASRNDAVDLFVTSSMNEPREPVTTDLSRPPTAPQRISRARGASTTSFPTTTSILTVNHADSKIPDFEEPIEDATVGTVVESTTSPRTSMNLPEGSSDITPSLISLRSTTITPGSPIPSSTNLSEAHQNSSQSTTAEMIPTVYLSPPSIPPSTLEDLITGPASLGKENQDELSELDVGDEDSVPSPSPLDPLLAGLISIFIISTAMLFIILFFKFRQQDGHPEFHRLQDLPMDDLLEDTPLSRYSY